jgi:hypothetical protein
LFLYVLVGIEDTSAGITARQFLVVSAICWDNHDWQSQIIGHAHVGGG